MCFQWTSFSIVIVDTERHRYCETRNKCLRPARIGLSVFEASHVTTFVNCLQGLTFYIFCELALGPHMLYLF
jgi:hypothetical protein